MKPRPLSDTDGAVRVYACGRCGRVHTPSFLEGTPLDLVARWQAEGSLSEAEACCRCASCKRELPPGIHLGECAVCERKEVTP